MKKLHACHSFRMDHLLGNLRYGKRRSVGGEDGFAVVHFSKLIEQSYFHRKLFNDGFNHNISDAVVDLAGEADMIQYALLLFCSELVLFH